MDETVDWLSDYFLRSRVSKPELRSFGLYSSWAPYVSEVVSLWEHLIGCLISVQLSNCARESVGSSKTMKGKSQMSACHHLLKLDKKCLYWSLTVIHKLTHFDFTALQDLHSKMVKFFKPWIFPLDTDDGGWALRSLTFLFLFFSCVSISCGDASMKRLLYKHFLNLHCNTGPWHN